MSTSTSWILFGLGSVAAIVVFVQALLGFKQQDMPYPKFSAGLAVALLLVQVAVLLVNCLANTHALERAHKKIAREVAFALWAFADQRAEALEKLTADYPYIFGYYHFRQPQPDFQRARNYLKNSIKRDLFVAPANYILAVATRLEKGDLSEAREYLDAGLKSDPQYSPLYVEKGLEATLGGRYRDSVRDFKEAIDLNSVHCLTINQTLEPQLSMEAWLRLQAIPEFSDLQSRCKAFR